MKKLSKLFPIFVFIFICAGNLNAQLGASDKKINIKFDLNDDEKSVMPSRPRIVPTKVEPKTETKPEITSSTFSLEKKVFALINEKRAEQGLPPLEWNDDVAKIARVHSQNMANYKFFSHVGIDGKMVNDRAAKLGVNKWSSIGENIAFNRGYENPCEFAVERWMLSASHKQNLLDNRWKESGIGVAVANDGAYYFTQVFLVRK
ncbi:MAG: CAP domain-containing protein [Pyrinomonadaceae bacterium]|nr:CAP domain-containing protein [Pyrinomonadaceae bacterium]